jgi:hypothetical protein
MSESGADQRPNFIYYFDIGLGEWQGKFLLTVTNWRKYWADHLGSKNRFLSLSLFLVLKLVGSAPITSHLEGDAQAGPGGVVANRVRISKFGLTLYLLEEHYHLDPDGTNGLPPESWRLLVWWLKPLIRPHSGAIGSTCVALRRSEGLGFTLHGL